MMASYQQGRMGNRPVHNAVNVPWARKSLMEQAVENLRVLIRKGTWQNGLPSERSLSRMADVSRPVLRQALHRLRDEGLLRIVRGRRAEILRPARRHPPEGEPGRVVILRPGGVPEEETTGRIEFVELRRELVRQGYRLDTLTDLRLQRKRPEPVLREILRQQAAHRWLLVSAPQAVQAWFASQRLPTVLIGHPFPRVELPFVDADWAGTMRHAVHALFRRRHRDIVCLLRAFPHAAGQEVAEQAFDAAARERGGAVCRMVHTTGDVAELSRTVGRLMAAARRPTGILVHHFLDLVTLLTLLQNGGFRIPADVSVIGLDHQIVLDRLVPRPACYRVDGLRFARRVCGLLRHPGGAASRVLLPSDFDGGETLAPPPENSARAAR
jgi:hypothetical protein